MIRPLPAAAALLLCAGGAEAASFDCARARSVSSNTANTASISACSSEVSARPSTFARA